MTEKNLILWYKGNEIKKDHMIEDASGNGFHGYVYGDLSVQEEGEKTYLCFNQKAQSYILLPKDILKSCQAVTIAAWIKPTTLDAWARLVDFGMFRDKNLFFALNSNVLNSNGGRPILSFTNENLKQVHSKTDLIVGKWQHVAITIDGKQAIIYINGIETGRHEQLEISPMVYIDGENYIGKSHFDVDPYYNGMMEDFRIYDTTLSKEAICAMMFEKMSDEEAVETVWKTLEIENGYLIKEDIMLSPNVLSGVDISWLSSNPLVVSETGKVQRPIGKNEKVTLTAQIKKGNIVKEKQFNLSILEEGMPSYSICIDEKQKGVDIDDTFIGIFFEDINYAADGGLYAELIQNRSFEFGQFKETLSVFDNPLHGWEIKGRKEDGFSYEIKTDTPIHENNPHYLEVRIQEKEVVELCNRGFGGIPLLENEAYRFSMFVKNQDFVGEIKVLLQDENGKTYSDMVFKSDDLTENWQVVENMLVSNGTDEKAVFVLQLKGKGTLAIDMVSLFPEATWENRKNGLRKDLVQSLKDLKPGFIRFPGGCIVEGKYLTNAYNWKDTIGPVETRKVNWNRWEEGNPYPYNQSYGLGFYEYFQLAEDIGAAPLPVVNCGMSCQFQGSEIAEDIEPYIQDALDLIEYANGDETTIWGTKRIKDGHKEPFNLVYLGIGNEQWVDYDKHVKDKYFTIYEMFRNRIKEKYPSIQLITTSGPFPDGKEFDIAWDIIHRKTKEYIAEDKVYAEIVDEHYYMSPEWFLENDNRYDHYPRYEDGKSAKVFAGEYACHTNGGPAKQGVNNLYAALCEAAFMIGLERNADIVAMTTYAPLFAKTINVQWQPDLIWFDNTKVYFSPSYYVQKMFGNNMGTYTLKTSIEVNSELTPQNHLPVYALGSKDEVTGDYIIKLVNASAVSHSLYIQVKNTEKNQFTVIGSSLTSESPSDVNTLEEPGKVKEKVFNLGEVEKDFTYTLQAHSFVVLRLK